MPHLLILVAAGAGLFIAGRWYRDMRRRVQADLRAAEEAMKQRNAEGVVPLEQDPSTGVYRPKHVTHTERSTRH